MLTLLLLLVTSFVYYFNGFTGIFVAISQNNIAKDGNTKFIIISRTRGNAEDIKTKIKH
jgi:hypothetical protein